MASPTDEIIEIADDPQLESLDPESLVEELEDDGRRRFGFLSTVPAWLVSTLIHVVILLVLGLVTVAEPIEIINVLTASSTAEDGPEIEEFTIDSADASEMSEMEEEVVDEVVETAEVMEMIEPVPVEPMEIATVAVDMSDMSAALAPSAASLQTISAMQMQPIQSRSEKMKEKLLREYGGNKSSESAVTEALKWFSKHQMPNGGWTFRHNEVCRNRCGNPGSKMKSFNGATSMAVLPFMGAGQTHLNGQFKDVIKRGLLYLIKNGKPGMKNGLPVLDLQDNDGNSGMYSHGLATITLCEAYAMTEDPAIAGPAQAALNFITYAQCRDGGWRYKPQQSIGGDTSVVGWQVMALKSGHMGHLLVPPQTIQGSQLFLDKVSSNGGAWYGYDKPSASMRTSTTAIGLLCRMYMGWDKAHPAIVRGVEDLSKKGMSKTDFYYNYYAAQVLRHYGGEKWEKFNGQLRDFLVSTQSKKSGEAGSWMVPSKSHSIDAGGRLLCTSFATMILEVYYRHMPLYADKSAEEDFPL